MTLRPMGDKVWVRQRGAEVAKRRWVVEINEGPGRWKRAEAEEVTYPTEVAARRGMVAVQAAICSKQARPRALRTRRLSKNGR